MKKLIYFSLLCVLASAPVLVYAQPANDLCSNAIPMTLATPTACPQGSNSGFNQGATTTLTGQTNVGATSSAPYPYLASCPINYYNTPRDVWYSFVATGFQTTITVSGATGTLTDPTITMWEGSCANLVGQGCSSGTGGTATLTVYQTVIGQTYYVQVAGADSTQTGTFTIAAACANNCAGCLQQSYITASPEPGNGGYAPGQTVEFCYTVTAYDEGNANWLHGITITLGSGWDTSTLVIDSTPPSCTPTAGAYWAYYPNGETSSATGRYFGPGFYYETSSGNTGCTCINSNPGDNFGDVDAGQGTCSPTFCIQITARQNDTAGADLNVTFASSGDGESGSWSSPGCAPDPSISSSAVSSCAAPRMAHIDASCHLPNGVDTAYAPEGNFGPYIYHWSNGVIDSSATFSVITGLAPGVYTVTVVNSRNCIVTNSDSIIDSTFAYGGPTKYVSCPVQTDSTQLTGVGTGTWTALSTNPGTTVITFPNSAITGVSGFTAFGTYRYVWTVGCATDTVSVIVTSHPNAGPDVYTCVNGTATMAAIGIGTWTALAINPAPTTIANPTSPTTSISGFTVGGTYYYTWSVGICLDTAKVIIPNFTSTASGGSAVLCRNLGTTLTATAGPSSLAPFTYTWLDSADVVSPHSASTATLPLLNPTNFIVQVTSASGCKLYDTVFVNIQGAAPVVIINTSNNNVCIGDTVTLSGIVYAENLVTCGTVDTCVNNNLLFEIPVNNDTSSTTGGTFGTAVLCSPFMGSYNSYKAQYLFTKQELNAAGLSSGSVTDISFFVKTINSTAGYDTFTVSMGCTNLDSLTGFVNNLQEVVPPQYGFNAVYPNPGWTPLPFTHFYNWDGASNLIVQVCYTISHSVSSHDDYVSYTTTSYNGSSYIAGDNFITGVNGCDITTSADLGPVALNTRPNIKFGMCSPNVLHYQWIPSTLLCDTCSATQVIVSSDKTYELVVTDNGCSNDTAIVIRVNPYIAFAATPDTTLCGADTVQLHALLTNPPASGCVQGYTVTSIPYTAISGSPIVIPGSAYISSFGGTNATYDGTAGPYSLGFNFPFYCESYNQFYVNSNGWITFNFPYPLATAAQEYTAQTLPPAPSDLDPQKAIELLMGHYEILSTFGFGHGTIGYFVSGTAPNRVLVVQFTGMGDYNTQSTTTSGEIHLYETTGVIDIMISSSDFSGVNHTTGIKDSTGLGIAAPGMNNQQYTVSSPVAWRFTPEYGASVAITSSIWSPNNYLSSDTSSNPYAYPPASQTYDVTSTLVLNQFTNPTSCVVHDSVRVNIDIFTHTLSSTPAAICPGDTAQITFTPDGVAPYTYVWTPAFGLSSATIASPGASVFDTTTYHIVATDINGCKVNDSITIDVLPTPTLVLTPDSVVCYSDSLLLQFPAGSYSLYQWYRIDSVTGARTLVSSGASNTSIYAHPQSGYILEVTPTAGGSCRYFTNIVYVDSFIRPPLYVIDSFGPINICAGQHAVLETEQGFTNVQWTPASYGSQTSFPVTTPGTFSYTARDGNGCLEYSNTVNVTVSPVPSYTFSNSKTTICGGQTDTIVVIPSPSNASVSWTFNGVTATGDTIYAADSGSYYIAVNDAGCADSGVVHVNSATNPLITLPLQSVTCNCTPQANPMPVGSTVNGGTPPYNYVWSPGGSGSTVFDTTLGTTPYTVTVIDAYGCTAVSNTEPVTLSCPDASIAISPLSDSIFAGSDTAIFTATPNHPDTSYGFVWSSSVNHTTTVLTPLSNIANVVGDSIGLDTVYLVVTDKSTGCQYSTFVTINVVEFGSFAMATAFTPNGDQKNDFFYPVLNGPNSPAHVLAFRIYNRWGQMVYDNPNAPGWDGNLGGNAQPSETYLYFLTIEYPDPNDASRTIQRSVEGSFQLFR
jgi:gliding motility-associated-like protein